MEMAPFDRPHASSYSPSIVTMAVSVAVSHISLLFSDLSTGLRSTKALNINFFLLPTKLLQPVNLAI